MLNRRQQPGREQKRKDKYERPHVMNDSGLSLPAWISHQPSLDTIVDAARKSACATSAAWWRTHLRTVSALLRTPGQGALARHAGYDIDSTTKS